MGNLNSVLRKTIPEPVFALKNEEYSDSKLIVDSDCKTGDYSSIALSDNKHLLTPVDPLVKEEIECILKNDLISVGCGHGFFASMMYAFDKHLPIALKPDHFWALILEGIVFHVDKNQEALRKQYVSFEGKKEIKINRNDLVPGSPNNDWPSLFEEFCTQIKSMTNEGVYSSFMGKQFSTTEPIDMVVRNVALMSTVKHYFDYTCSTCCGYPHIRLLGTKADWEALISCLDTLPGLLLEDFAKVWIPDLRSCLQPFVDAFEATPKRDMLFWKSMMKWDATHGSGARTYVSGWINTFFPFLDAGQTVNRYAYGWEERKKKMELHETNPKNQFGGSCMEGNECSDFAFSMSWSPVKWQYYDTVIPLYFKAGFIGGKLNDQKEVVPVVSWVITRPQFPKEPRMSWEKHMLVLPEGTYAERIKDKIETEGVVRYYGASKSIALEAHNSNINLSKSNAVVSTRDKSEDNKSRILEYLQEKGYLVYGQDLTFNERYY
jgi:hypothetical protein